MVERLNRLFDVTGFGFNLSYLDQEGRPLVRVASDFVCNGTRLTQHPNGSGPVGGFSEGAGNNVEITAPSSIIGMPMITNGAPQTNHMPPKQNGNYRLAKLKYDSVSVMAFRTRVLFLAQLSVSRQETRKIHFGCTTACDQILSATKTDLAELE